MTTKENIDNLTVNSPENHAKIALVTGANSGLGLETAALLAEQGFSKVILAVRTADKGEEAKTKLIKRTGKEVFDILAVDVSESKSAQAAADKLLNRKDTIDLLILNAGMSSGGKRIFNTDGVEMTFASHLVGHHILTMRLLGDGLLSSDAHIVIVGSEGARGDLPGMNPVEFRNFADEHFDGDLVKALESIGRYEDPFNGKDMDVYVTTKVYSTWWAAVLSRKLPQGMVVNAVSPGSVPDTNYARNMGFFTRRIMMPLMKHAPKRLGMGWSLSEGASRYIEAGNFDVNTTGHFFASPPRKMTGKMEIQQNEHFLNHDFQEAGWKAIVKLSEGVDYPLAPPEETPLNISSS